MGRVTVPEGSRIEAVCAQEGPSVCPLTCVQEGELEKADIPLCVHLAADGALAQPRTPNWSSWAHQVAFGEYKVIPG